MLGSLVVFETTQGTDWNKKLFLMHEERCQMKRSQMWEWAHPPEVPFLLIVSSHFFKCIFSHVFVYS